MDVRLCSVCTGIDFQRISPPQLFPLHDNLQQLRECGKGCFLCEQTYSKLVERLHRDNAQSLDESHQSLYQVRLKLDTSLAAPTGQLVVSVSKRDNLSTDDRSSIPLRGHDDSADRDISISISVYTDENDPAMKIIPWIRQVGEYTGSVETLRLACSWIGDCVSGNCTGRDAVQRVPELGYGGSVTASRSEERPTRLIEIESDYYQLKLVRARQISAPYVALSYVWGQQAATWKTVEANLVEREAGFSMQDLPLTLRDAVWITHSLGYRFLWIDCLCIVQDDLDEWKKEASKMASIYKYAVVTIVADFGGDSTSGIFNPESFSIMDDSPHARVTNTLHAGRQSTLYLAPSTYIYDDADFCHSPPSTRGWCCQERVASSRTLHFGETQLFWECMHCSLAEDNIGRWYPLKRISSMIFHDSSSGPPSLEHWQRAWYDSFISADYSQRRLTYVNDKLNAVAGVAALFHSLRPSRYFAGHWEENLLPSLCWSASSINGKKGKAISYRAPTWSWASQDCPVLWNVYMSMKVFTPYAEALAVLVDGDPANPFGEVRSGFLRLHAPTLHGGRLASGRHKSLDLHFENGMFESASMDTDDPFDGDIVSCLLGVADNGDDACTGYSLLLERVGTQYRRIGLLDTIYAPKRRDNTTRILHGIEELEPKRLAPLEEITII